VNEILGRTKRGHVRFGRIASLVGHHDPDWWPSSRSEETTFDGNGNGTVAIVAVVIGVMFVALLIAFVK
jgi:hypothetical protein